MFSTKYYKSSFVSNTSRIEVKKKNIGVTTLCFHCYDKLVLADGVESLLSLCACLEWNRTALHYRKTCCAVQPAICLWLLRWRERDQSQGVASRNEGSNFALVPAFIHIVRHTLCPAEYRAKKYNFRNF